jgi:SAM-dependent methyltransferase
MSQRSTHNPYLRQLLPQPSHRSPQVIQTLAAIEELMPQDDFSRAQWEMGLDYYERRLAAFGLSGTLLVDLGCGTGNWSIAAAHSYSRVVGIDASAERIRLAERIQRVFQYSNVQFVHGSTLSEASVENGSVDCIVIYNTLQYLPTRKAVIQDAFRLLKPGGVLWCSWNGIGILPYYLKVMVGMRRPDLTKAFMQVMYYKMLTLLKIDTSGFNGMYLSSEKICAELSEAGFATVWKSWQSPWPAAASPLFPGRRYGLPFFEEVLARKPPAIGSPSERDGSVVL